MGSTQIPDFSPSHDDLDQLIYAAPVGQTSWYNNVYDRFDNRRQQNVTAGSGPVPQYSFDASNLLLASLLWLVVRGRVRC